MGVCKSATFVLREVKIEEMIQKASFVNLAVDVRNL